MNLYGNMSLFMTKYR